MNEWILTLLSALWLGVVTSVSPCPLATNVAAVSVLSRQVGNRKRAVAGAMAYTAGRMAVYLGLALVIFAGVSSMPAMSSFLREEISPLIGPVLILAGMALLGLLPLPVDLKLGNPDTAEKLKKGGLLGEFCIGGLFALSFCPVSAALFFGSLIPLSVASDLPPLTVLLYGLGTALPVGIIALLLIFSTEKAAKTLNKIQAWQKNLTRITGVVLILAGCYLTIFDTILPSI